jgi:hypothetical protein
LRTQREVLCDVMLSASQCGTWLTLQELSLLTHYGEASISAQLRHLRKRQFGGFVVEKRQRDVDAVVRREVGVVWEYQLRRGVRRKFLRRRVPRGGRGLAVVRSS